MLYIAMNRFRIAAGFEDGFEEMWRTRDSKLSEVAGFQDFKLLRGGELESGGTLFISHSAWESYDEFREWTESDAFKAAHGKSRAPEGTYLGHPDFEGFEVVIS
jgi:heme-degrading monooxygenase HmoA